jgi:citrate lyase synthetase
MPYALIPDGYSLKKVTKLQKQAVNEKRRHDDVVAILSNENTPLVLAGVIAAILIPTIAQQVATDTGLSLDIVTDSIKTAFYEGTLLGKATQFVQGLDLSELGKVGKVV